MKNKTFILFGRLMRHVLRSPDTIITVAIIPIAMMLLFVFVLGGAIAPSIDSNINYVTYQLPGIMLMAVASGISYTAYRIFQDVRQGIFERFSSMPIKRSSALWAHVLTSVISNLITIILIITAALIIGFRTSAGVLQWLGVTGILIFFTLALTWVSVIPGLTAKSAEGAGAFSYPLIFLPFLSSAFVPTSTMPAAVRVFAENQPVTSIVNTIRALWLNEPVGGEIWSALAWCGGICIIAYIFAMKAYKRKALNY